MKKRLISMFLSFILAFLYFTGNSSAVAAATKHSDITSLMSSVTMELNSNSACLMEASTGEVLYEQNADERLEPASVTKVMVLLLIMEALRDGVIKLDDMVTGSMKASQMGGSQIWLEYGEQFSVDDMLKAIIVVSANDCTVAMAEHLAGSEEAFVALMNKRASELGMQNTQFKNTTGLPEEGHYTSARDIAIMSRELLKYNTIFNYTTIWMDSLRDGQMGLSNTNKLIRFYTGANGLKTGFTSSAGYCLSGTAKRNDMQLIATVMKAPTSDQRFEDAKKLLDYGFANFTVYKIADTELTPVKVNGGVAENVGVKYTGQQILLAKGKEKLVESVTELSESVNAPVKAGDKLGVIRFALNGEEIASVDIVATENVDRIQYFGLIAKVFKKLIMFR